MWLRSIKYGSLGGKEKNELEIVCVISWDKESDAHFFSELFFFSKKKKRKKRKEKNLKKKSDRYRGSISRPHGWIKDILPVRLDTLWQFHDQYYIWTTTFSIFSSKLQTALSPLGSPPHTPGFFLLNLATLVFVFRRPRRGTFSL